MLHGPMPPAQHRVQELCECIAFSMPAAYPRPDEWTLSGKADFNPATASPGRRIAASKCV